MKKMIAFLVINIIIFSCTVNNKITEINKKEILLELAEIRKLDQLYAGLPPDSLINKYGSEKAWEVFERKGDSVNLINQQRIKRLYEKFGFLGENKVGKKAATNFWLPIQHADNDISFQLKMLNAMKKEIQLENIDKYHLAMLEDRTNVNLGRKQRFGSQVTYKDNGQAIPKIGLMDTIIVDSLRKEYSLPGIKEYYNEMTIMQFEMNKNKYLEKGITKPVLYK